MTKDNTTKMCLICGYPANYYVNGRLQDVCFECAHRKEPMRLVVVETWLSKQDIADLLSILKTCHNNRADPAKRLADLVSKADTITFRTTKVGENG
jgi:hypothetical protein